MICLVTFFYSFEAMFILIIYTMAFLLDAKKYAFSAKLLPQDFVFLTEISYNFLLLPAHPSGNGHGKECPWFPNHDDIVTGKVGM